MVEIDADITPKSTSFSAGRIDHDYTACAVPRQCRAVHSRSDPRRQRDELGVDRDVSTFLAFQRRYLQNRTPARGVFGTPQPARGRG